jgi:hypothetical protein
VLKLNTAIVLPLPASWAHGFPALQELTLRSDAGRLDGASRLDRARHGYQASAAQHSSSPSSLPAEWARGFPALQTLRLDCLALGGTFPAAWQARGSFPQLRELVLGGNLLSGPLPADILCNLPSLTYLNLGSNQFTGGLPSKWASCLNDIFQIEVMGNQLTGPAFPPAWLAPNSMLNLRHYEISDNPGLVGSLPPSLNWSRLELL